jgi:ubiquitin carboxyl-terminal hydrolase 25/28
VTSRDEEEDEAVTGGSESSNDTDATLVDDDFGSAIPASEPPLSHASSTSSNSILGKRGREVDKQKTTSVMDVDDGYVLVSSPRREGSPQPMEADRSSPMKGLADRDGDIAMKGVTPAPERPPPPLPKPRPETVDYSGGMMFGMSPFNFIWRLAKRRK